MTMVEAYTPDVSLRGKLRRRYVRWLHRKPVTRAPARPMLSFAFDDAPLTATMAGAEILEKHGIRGTWFFAAGLADRDGHMGRFAGQTDALRLAAAGHEIGCHTYSHLDCGRAAGPRISEDVARNTEVLAAWGLPPARTFAYPYGDVSIAAKSRLGGRFELLRGLHQGLIEQGGDLNQTPAVGIEGPEGEANARAWMQKAHERNAWLILYTHDVTETPSQWGCTPGALDRLAGEGVAAGFDIVTVGEGARRLG